MSKFLESKEVFVVKGYLSSSKDKVQPICNQEFVKAQQDAEFIISFAKKAKGKDFTGKTPDSFVDLLVETASELSQKNTKYVTTPKKVEKKLSNQLKEEALAFIKYEEESSKIDKVNNYLQRYNVISEFEEIGLFFEDDICKLNKIYTMKEIVDAAKVFIEITE
jgi:hypothetical protein